MQSSDDGGALMSLADAADQQIQGTKIGPDGLFQCGYCKRNYNRADHLIRHVRSHTQEKPYVCPVCAKGFARPDLVKRHALSHDVEPDGKRRKHQGTPTQSARVSQACKACAASKLKCAEEKPCRRCRQKNIICDFTPLTSAGPTSSLDAGEDDSGMQEDYMYSERSQANNVPDFSQFQTSDTLIQGQQAFSHTDGVLELDGTFFPGFLRDVMVPPNIEFPPAECPPGYLNQGFTPREFMDYGIETSLELDDRDFGYLDAFNAKNTINLVQPAVDQNSVAPMRDFEKSNGVAIGAEAFRRSSLAGWTPAHQDHGYAEEQNLSLPNDVDSPESRLTFDRRILSERLTQSSRDKILGMVLDNCMPSNVTKIVASFPSADILDNLIQSFFGWQVSQIENWIHLPTFRTNSQRPELLGIIAAAGAARTSVPTVRKLGFALQEAVRLSLPKQFESDNSTTRELPFLQCYLLQLKTGLWSGNRRKIEIAESFAQPLITMIRRARRFRRSAYPPPISPLPDDMGETLDKKWRAWAARESFKRFVFNLFIHDAQVSMSLNVNPLISYAELSLPLPASQDLWQATDSSQWKQMYFLKDPAGPVRLPSFVDVLQDMSQLSVHQILLDTQLSGLVVLHGLWGLIWEHRQLNSLAKAQSSHWNGLVLSSRHQELAAAMTHFRISSSEWSVPLAPEVRLIQELVSMHLYMSFEELQLFAGKEDKEEARKVYYSATQWIESPASREAVWHAGQILRAAKRFRFGTLRDFYAIAVYHASLAFWSYGVVTRAHEAEMQPSQLRLTAGDLPPIWLDDTDPADLPKFVTLKRGKPGLKGSDRHVLLDDPAAVMDVARDVLRFHWGDELPPPLVENLSQLMRDLGTSARAGNQ